MYTWTKSFFFFYPSVCIPLPLSLTYVTHIHTPLIHTNSLPLSLFGRSNQTEKIRRIIWIELNCMFVLRLTATATATHFIGVAEKDRVLYFFYTRSVCLINSHFSSDKHKHTRQAFDSFFFSDLFVLLCWTYIFERTILSSSRVLPYSLAHSLIH